MLSHILAPLLHLAAWQVYLIVGALAFGEAAVLLGFVLPGETAVILGGVASRIGHAHLPVMIVIAVVAAVAGDTTGYEIGRVVGPRLLSLRPLRARSAPFDAARSFLDRYGAWAVFVGRFTAFLRAVIPGLAGISGMRYGRFLLANATGGVVWAVGYSLLGYGIGAAYQKVEHYSTIGSSALLGVIVVAAIGLRVRARRRERRLAAAEAAHLDARALAPTGEPGPATGTPL